MTERSWTDQPIEVDGSAIVFTGKMAGRVVEVREGTVGWYVTQGNLFGSETIRVGSARDALRILNVIEHARGQVQPLPKYATLLQNANA